MPRNSVTEEKVVQDNEIKEEKIQTEDKTPKATPRKKAAKRPTLKELQKENEQLKQQLAELQNKYIRLNAELYNLRKRYDKEMENVVIYSNQKLIEKILPLVDDLERSLKMSETNKNFEAFVNGIEIIYKNLLKVLEEVGVKPIKAVGEKFDYNLHEAVLAVHKEGVESGTIVDEVQKGYLYKDRVLRHSKVVVAK